MTIRKVLIANRGEIAVRIEKACARAGLQSVAVYAEPDRGGLHSRFADEAYPLGSTSLDKDLLGSSASARQAYLDATMLLRIARKNRVDAIHPGYGFFAEDPDFARQVIDARLAWIGPSPAALETVTAFNRSLAPEGARVDPARHIEIQLLGDSHGEVIVVGTRDGSVRHLGHALIAESPAPFLRAQVRRDLETAALAAVSALGVVVAGPLTAEFDLGEDGSFALTRLTPRLTVGHPCTEEAYNLDLVRAQLRIAAGEGLWLQGPLPAVTQAATVRVDAADHDLDLLEHRAAFIALPDTRLVRVDAGITQGQAVSDEFDTPLVKLTAAAETRFEALEALREAMLGVVID
ncbi:MAG: hypothetical protein FWG11_09135, partial [Promicromonosporaceae bacterium]|nr:hypothetical protein [Promicromonosporaceae bacterium]